MVKWWQWLAKKAKIQERVDYATKMAWFRMGIARATGKPADLSWQDYPMYLDRVEGAAYVQMFDNPPQVASYEPPEKQTGPIAKRILKSARDVARERGYQTSMTRPVGIPPHVQGKPS